MPIAETPTRARQHGATLRRLRQERGIKPGDLADRVGLTSKTISNAECEGGSLSVEALYRIAAVLGVPLAALLSEHGREELEGAAR